MLDDQWYNQFADPMLDSDIDDEVWEIGADDELSGQEAVATGSSDDIHWEDYPC